MADALDSKSGAGNSVWVRLPPPAPLLFSIFVRNPCFNWDYLDLFLYV